MSIQWEQVMEWPASMRVNQSIVHNYNGSKAGDVCPSSGYNCVGSREENDPQKKSNKKGGDLGWIHASQKKSADIFAKSSTSQTRTMKRKQKMPTGIRTRIRIRISLGVGIGEETDHANYQFPPTKQDNHWRLRLFSETIRSRTRETRGQGDNQTHSTARRTQSNRDSHQPIAQSTPLL